MSEKVKLLSHNMDKNTLATQIYQWQLFKYMEVNTEKFQHRTVKDGNIENHHASQEAVTYW